MYVTSYIRKNKIVQRLHSFHCSNYRCTIVKHYYVGCCLIETKISGGAPRVWSRGVRPSSAISPLSTYNQMCLGPPPPRYFMNFFTSDIIHCSFITVVDVHMVDNISIGYEGKKSHQELFLKRRPVEWNSGRQASHLAAICRPFRCTDHKWSPLRVTLTSREKTWKITLRRVKLSISTYLLDST